MSAQVIAHLGHDVVTLAFFVPTVGFIVWLLVTQFRQRRGVREGDGGPSQEG